MSYSTRGGIYFDHFFVLFFETILLLIKNDLFQHVDSAEPKTVALCCSLASSLGQNRLYLHVC